MSTEEGSDLTVNYSPIQDELPPRRPDQKRVIVWRSLLLLSLLHLGALLALCLTPTFHWYTLIAIQVLGILSSFGIIAGAHRLWSHRSYKANLPLQLLLAALQTLTLQDSIYDWVRNHRSHHKWSDTDADPHNSRRGFFFSHMGWLMVKKHPEVLKKGATLDLSDLEADPIVRFQRRWYIPLVVLFWGAIPAAIPVFGWDEAWLNSFLGVVILRYTTSLHITWLVNSWAHAYGTRPYDGAIVPVEMALIAPLTLGGGFHNYHHAFPWDYSASELGPLDVFNPATGFINFFAAIGWATQLRKATPELVAAKCTKRGDSSARYSTSKGGRLKRQLVAFAQSAFLWPFLPLLALKWTFQ